MSAGRPAPRRVFLSHTSELRRLPADKPFIEAAKSAVARAGDSVVSMDYFSAQAQPPAEVCAREVEAADVFVLIAGFRRGSMVEDRPDLSYTELELEVAERTGLPRLVFLLGKDTTGPADLFRGEDVAGQDAFRTRLADSGVTTATVINPDQLETELLQALTGLPPPKDSRPLPRGTGATCLWSIPSRLGDFVGREDLLDRLGSMPAPCERMVVHAVHGMGGIGKTTTVIEYAYRHRPEFDIAWWIDAADPDRALDRLAELARALDLGPADEPAETAAARLFAELCSRDRWLIVFDNAESPRAVSHLLPDGPGQVLITSRNPAWHGVASQLGMDQLTRSESVDLLYARAPDLSAEDADRIAAALGDLPLALVQAGSMLADTHLDAGAYLRLLGQCADRLLGHDTGGVYPVSVAASWAVAFDRLAADDPVALELLTLIAWCGPEPVPLGLITDHPDTLPDELRELVADQVALARCCSLLRRRSMAVVSSRSMHMHRVPAALLRARTALPADAGGGEWPRTVVHLLRTTLPEEVRDSAEMWPPQWSHLLQYLSAVEGFGLAGVLVQDRQATAEEVGAVTADGTERATGLSMEILPRLELRDPEWPNIVDVLQVVLRASYAESSGRTLDPAVQADAYLGTRWQRRFRVEADGTVVVQTDAYLGIRGRAETARPLVLRSYPLDPTRLGAATRLQLDRDMLMLHGPDDLSVHNVALDLSGLDRYRYTRVCDEDHYRHARDGKSPLPERGD